MKKQILIQSDISWLSFNARVLQEAKDKTVPLSERIRFLGIYCNNRDEFFRVRVAKLEKLIKLSDKKDDLSRIQELRSIVDQIQNINMEQQKDFNRIWQNILKELKKRNVFLVDEQHLNAEQKNFVRKFFDDEVSSTVTPLFIENISEIPNYYDNHFFLGIRMWKKRNRKHNQKYAIIEIPSIPRFVLLPSKHGEQQLILLEDIIRFNLPYIFSYLGYDHFQAHTFKITKDAEIKIDKNNPKSIVEQVEAGVKNRRKAKIIRFLYDKQMNPGLSEYLLSKLKGTDNVNIIPGSRIRNFRDFMDFPLELEENETRQQQPFTHPLLAKTLRICDVILERDVLLHFPFHSFNSVIDLLREAAMDSDVISIKITAYRLASNSKVCNALINAVRNGKEVHVILELCARFDEQANLAWKIKLEEEGVKVFIGIPDMKVHAKIGIITKRAGRKEVQYGFIGTGNLNEKTAKRYVDHCLLTSNVQIMNDIDRVFRVLENPKANWSQLALCKTLLISPVSMRKRLNALIDREIKYAKLHKPAKIILNLNSLSDERMIKKLYSAARAGVTIKMVVRGIFCAVIDQKQFDQRMTAVSIVDEYLEHSRVLWFQYGQTEKVYISSADWMTRNLDNRIEVAVPILDKSIKEELKRILEIKLSDNVKGRLLDIGCTNQYVSSEGDKPIRSQLAIYRYLRSLYKKDLPKDGQDINSVNFHDTNVVKFQALKIPSSIPSAILSRALSTSQGLPYSQINWIF